MILGSLFSVTYRDNVTGATRAAIQVTPRICRGGYVFQTWVGDHPPRHVHVYRDDRLIVRWNLDDWKPVEGKAPRRVVKLIRELVEEGRL